MEPFKFDQDALQAHLRGIESMIASAPQHILDQVRHAQQIDAHNAAIDVAKAQKKQFREMAKKARIPVEALKRMVRSVRKI